MYVGTFEWSVEVPVPQNKLTRYFFRSPKKELSILPSILHLAVICTSKTREDIHNNQIANTKLI